MKSASPFADVDTICIQLPLLDTYSSPIEKCVSYDKVPCR